ncbi:MAG: hypothetical protein D6681_20915 [Calditrichaeota bacterium]|nr:MAG: hypothetical protein D6681_20915 [Calditrichota bacterium]
MKYPTAKCGRRPLIFAHRGANSFAPENSLAAFEAALQMGCDGIEMDLRFTASGDVVVFHDRRTYRMTGCRGHVHQLSLKQLREFRLQEKREHFIPTLQEALELIRDRTWINLDVKKESMRSNGFEEKILSILRDFHLCDNIIISSFNPVVIKRFHALAPEFRLGFIYKRRSHKIVANGVPLDSLHVYYRALSRRYVANLHARGYRVYAWTVDRESSMRRMLEKGVDGIITNKPESFYQLVGFPPGAEGRPLTHSAPLNLQPPAGRKYDEPRG